MRHRLRERFHFRYSELIPFVISLVITKHSTSSSKNNSIQFEFLFFVGRVASFQHLFCCDDAVADATTTARNFHHPNVLSSIFSSFSALFCFLFLVLVSKHSSPLSLFLVGYVVVVVVVKQILL
jgi:hypothetical protein